MSSESRQSSPRRGGGDRGGDSPRDRSRSHSPRRHQQDDQMPNKIFVTNLEAGVKHFLSQSQQNPKEIEDELKNLFSKYGEISSCVVKVSHNREYCFAFIDYTQGNSNAVEAMKKLNGVALGEKPMKVELQDNARRRKTNSEGCYKCGKPGHFARECRGERMDERDRYRDRRGRSRSRDHSRDRRKKKSHHRHRSESSESRHRKKDKKKHKSHKKHKKSKKKHYSSDSDSSN